MSEEWRDIDGYEGRYQVSDAGRVRSLDLISRSGRFCAGRVLKQGIDEQGRPRIDLKRDGERRNLKVCRLVARAFIGKAPSDTECCHENGNPGDNRKTNLRWGTHQSNVDDTLRHGNRLHGVLISWSILTDEKIEAARHLRNAGLTYGQIAERLGVNRMTVWDALNGRTWKAIA